MSTSQTQFELPQATMSRNKWLATWRAANVAANEAIRAVAQQSRLALDHMADPPSETEVRHANGLREVADALLHQVIACKRTGSTNMLTSPRLGYDEMWLLALRSESRASIKGVCV